MAPIRTVALVAVLLLSGSAVAHAFGRPSFEDATVVERSELNHRRRDLRTEVYYGVAALRTLRDSRARGVLEQTEKRWQTIDFSNRYIVEECAAALGELAAAEKEANKPRR